MNAFSKFRAGIGIICCCTIMAPACTETGGRQAMDSSTHDAGIENDSASPNSDGTSQHDGSPIGDSSPDAASTAYPSTSSACDDGPAPGGGTYYVATDGTDDELTDGSSEQPWATITYALDNVPDGSVIRVRPGRYDGRVRIRGSFTEGVAVCSAEPYAAQLRHSGAVVTAYTAAQGCHGITIEGFDIAHDGAGADALVVHIDGNGDGSVWDITLRNNILHDSYDNDILKVNNGIHDVLIQGNLFYNQAGSDEHIDINSAKNVFVQGNIFMNDFAGSERPNGNDTSSYIVVKDSNQDSDVYVGSEQITIVQNVFANWEGSDATGFLLLGEDGHDFYEAHDITVENNLMLGNSANPMRSPFGVKGGRDIVFRHNTVVGNLPARAFAMRLNTEGDNPANDNIQFYNNIWSDPTGTMGALGDGSSNDFTDTPIGQTLSFVLDHNLYFNGYTDTVLNDIPEDSADAINVSDDNNQTLGDPQLGDQSGLLPPHWDEDSKTFTDGSTTIRQAFERLVQNYGTLGSLSAALGQALATESPAVDILGNPRDNSPDIGAYERP